MHIFRCFSTWRKLVELKRQKDVCYWCAGAYASFVAVVVIILLAADDLKRFVNFYHRTTHPQTCCCTVCIWQSAKKPINAFLPPSFGSFSFGCASFYHFHYHKYRSSLFTWKFMQSTHTISMQQ